MPTDPLAPGIEIINLCPHPVIIYHQDDTTRVFPEKRADPRTQVPRIARVRQPTKEVGALEGIPLVQISAGEIVGLPEPRPGVFYIVSTLVFLAAPENRYDLLVPAYPVRHPHTSAVIGNRGFRTRATPEVLAALLGAESLPSILEKV